MGSVCESVRKNHKECSPTNVDECSYVSLKIDKVRLGMRRWRQARRLPSGDGLEQFAMKAPCMGEVV
jgi:hypothetical protein